MKKWLNALLMGVIVFSLMPTIPAYAATTKGVPTEILESLETESTRAPQSNAKVYVQSVRVCGERFWGQIENISGTVLENTVFIVASYDGENGLINTVVEPVAEIAIGGAYKIDVPFNFEGAYILKLFVWESFETLKPYCAAYLPLGLPSVEGELQNFIVTAKFPNNEAYVEPILPSDIENLEIVFKAKNISGTTKKVGFILFLYNSNDVWIANTAVTYPLTAGQEDEFVVPLTDTAHKAALIAQLSGYAAEDLYLRVLVDDDPTDVNGFCKNMATVTAVNADYYGNTGLSAFPIEIGENIEGNVDYSGDLDYFKFDTAADKTTTLNVTGNAAVEVYNEVPALVTPSGNGMYELQAGSYYVKVSGAVGAYTLSVTQAEVINNRKYELNCVIGQDYLIVVSGNDIVNPGDIITLEYDSSHLSILDLCALTPVNNTTVGQIAGTSIEVTSLGAGTIRELKFKVNKTLGSNILLSGILNAIKFNALKNGTTTVIIK